MHKFQLFVRFHSLLCHNNSTSGNCAVIRIQNHCIFILPCHFKLCATAMWNRSKAKQSKAHKKNAQSERENKKIVNKNDVVAGVIVGVGVAIKWLDLKLYTFSMLFATVYIMIIWLDRRWARSPHLNSVWLFVLRLQTLAIQMEWLNQKSGYNFIVYWIGCHALNMNNKFVLVRAKQWTLIIVLEMRE